MSYRYYGAPVIKYDQNRASMVLRGLGDPVLEDLKRSRFRQALTAKFGAAAMVKSGLLTEGRLKGSLGNEVEQLSVDYLEKFGIDETQAAQLVNAISDFGGALMSGKDLIATGKAFVTEALSQAVVVTLLVGGTAVCAAAGAAAGVLSGGVGAAIAPLCTVGMLALLETIPFDKLIGPVVSAIWEVIQGAGTAFESLFKGNLEDAFNDLMRGLEAGWNALVTGVLGDQGKYNKDSWEASIRMMHSLVEMGALVAAQERMAILTVMRLRNQMAGAANDPVVWGYQEATNYFESKYYANMDVYPKNSKGQYILGKGVTKIYSHAGFTGYGGLRKILPLYKRVDAPTRDWREHPGFGTLWPRSIDRPIPTPEAIRKVEYQDADRLQHHFSHYVPFGWLDQEYDQNFSGYPGIGEACGPSYCQGGAPNGRPKDGVEYFKPMAHVLLINGGWGAQGKNASVTRFSGPYQAYMLDLKQRQSDIAQTLVAIQKELVNQYAEKISQVTTAYNAKNLAKSAYDAKTAYFAKTAYLAKVQGLATQKAQEEAAAAATQRTVLTVCVLGGAAGLAWYFWPRGR